MKRLTTIITAMVMLFSASAFAAGNDNVTAKVKAAFETDFAKASTVSWEKKGELYFAEFKLNDMLLNAAYTEEGDLVATSRRISFSQVPITISLALEKKYKGYELPAEVLELNFEGSTSYYATIMNDKQVLEIKSNAYGEITVDKKFKR